MKRKLWDIWTAVLRNADAGGAAAPAQAAAPPPGLVAAAAAAAAPAGDPPAPAPAAPAAGAEGGKPAEGAPPAGEVYFPQGLPETLKGKTERETLDNIAKHLSGQPKPPEKPDGYKFEPSDAFKQRYGDTANDPVMKLWSEVAHGLGLTNEQYSKAATALFEKMAEAKLIDDPVDVGAELAKLAPPTGDPKQKAAEAAQRVNTAVGWIDGQMKRGALSDAEAAKLTGLAVDAVGVQLIEKLMRLGGERGLQGAGQGGAGGGQQGQAELLNNWFPSAKAN